MPPGSVGEVSDDEDERGLLQHGAPFTGRFDEAPSRVGTPSGRPSTGYTLTDSYAGELGAAAPPYNDPYNGAPAGYSGTTLEEPSVRFGPPGRAPSPYARNETSSTEAWRERQAPTVDPVDLRRFGTRKVKLVGGSVLSVDYPVPTAIQNAVQAKYHNDLENGSEEFTHMRCALASSNFHTSNG